MLATEKDFRIMLGGIGSEALPSSQITQLLADAYLIVSGEGISDDNPFMAQLMRYKAADLAVIEGVIGIPTSESVADSSIDFQDNSSAIGEAYHNGWERLYRLTLARAATGAVGFGSRIA